MVYVEAPDRKYPQHLSSLFIAGSITDAPNWQKDLVKKLDNLDIVIFNPRRKGFDVRDPANSVEQINWEYDMLETADMISFWFCKETLSPITLFELGKVSQSVYKANRYRNGPQV
jgi:hypothetical protein